MSRIMALNGNCPAAPRKALRLLRKWSKQLQDLRAVHATSVSNHEAGLHWFAGAISPAAWPSPKAQVWGSSLACLGGQVLSNNNNNTNPVALGSRSNVVHHVARGLHDPFQQPHLVSKTLRWRAANSLTQPMECKSSGKTEAKHGAAR